MSRILRPIAAHAHDIAGPSASQHIVDLAPAPACILPPCQIPVAIHKSQSCSDRRREATCSGDASRVVVPVVVPVPDEPASLSGSWSQTRPVSDQMEDATGWFWPKSLIGSD